MNTLFDLSELEIEQSKELKLKVVANKNKQLTKNQQNFNRLITRVENLQNEIIVENEKLNNLLKIYNEKIPSVEKAIANVQIKVAKKITISTQSTKYGKRQIENVGTVIVHLLDQAFIQIEPDEETEKIYDQWSEFSYQEEKEYQLEQMKQEMESLLREQMGFNFDFKNFDNSPESFAKLQQKLREELNNKKNDEEPSFAEYKSKPKTKKQLEKELRKKEAEAIRLKSVRAIYISLAKVLHPDTEIDPEEKSKKEELMKKVTVAYQEKDLPTLLKLEMEWVAAESHNLDKMSDDKLKLYISALLEQVAELEDERYSIRNHPRFQAIIDFSRFTEAVGIHQIMNQLSQLKQHKTGLESLLSTISQPNSKKYIMDFVNQSVEFIDNDPWDFF